MFCCYVATLLTSVVVLGLGLEGQALVLENQVRDLGRGLESQVVINMTVADPDTSRQRLVRGADDGRCSRRAQQQRDRSDRVVLC